MGMTLVTDDKGVRVFANEKETSNGNKFTLYSLAVSSKDQEGKWATGYINCKFKKGVVVTNKSKIKINNSFFIVTKGGNKTYTSLMITDFEVLEEGETPNEEGWVDMSGIKEGELPFAD